MKKRSDTRRFLIIQLVVVAILVISFFVSDTRAKSVLEEKLIGLEPFQPVNVERTEPIRIAPLYNRPDLVSDDDLAAVLQQIVPRFDPHEMKPNYIEHALRTWGVEATFQDPDAISGQQMFKFLTDSGVYLESWGKKVRPLLEEKPTGIQVRWGTEKGASYHHDHLIACVTEAGATLDAPVFGPSRQGHTLNNVLQESLRDFRLDERETEWTAMAFGLWIPPVKTWTGGDGRDYSFDLIARRLLRGQKQYGVCSGTHRVYSLMLLIRLDDDHDILADDVREEVWSYLEATRDAISASQFADGSWPVNWPDGEEAVADPEDAEFFQKIISTGHHLEWLSIAPPELHPPEEQIKKAIDWIVATTKSQTAAELKQRYTFFSHVGAALANWRQVRTSDFWREWEEQHPDAE